MRRAASLKLLQEQSPLYVPDSQRRQLQHFHRKSGPKHCYHAPGEFADAHLLTGTHFRDGWILAQFRSAEQQHPQLRCCIGYLGTGAGERTVALD